MSTQTKIKQSFSSLALATALALPLAAAPAAFASETARAGQAVENAAITASIKSQLIADERTRAFDINVDTTGEGQVLLRGTAPSEDAKRAAAEIAAQVDGVSAVENAIVVAPPGSVAERSAPPATASQHARHGLDRAGEATSDAWLTTKVKAALMADSDVKGLRIKVRTDDNVVRLEGEVPDEAMKARAIELAAGIEGVVHVDSDDLIVSR